eukprot:GDKK01018969.1.p1 GENE.GDKK01018969.1~~GDKK01018969.1.p1  ORF type:complete len:223 (-),score=11.73 GDKK01018969.1:57-701(-)
MSDLVPIESGTLQCAMRQRNNPILQCVTHVRTSYVDIIPDFRVGGKICIYFCSIAYHRRNPAVLERKIKDAKPQLLRYSVKILLIHVNLDSPEKDIEYLTEVANDMGFTVMIAWTPIECARILEYYVVHENRSTEMIQGKIATEHTDRAIQLLAKVPTLNTTDARNILFEMETMKNIAGASIEQLQSFAGVGGIKSEKLWKVMNVSFRSVEIDK